MNIAQHSDTKRNLIGFAAAIPLAFGLLTAIYAATGVIG